MPVIVRKSADEIVNNDNVLQDDDELFFAIGANEVWVFKIIVFYDSEVAPDFAASITVPAGADFRAGFWNDARNEVINVSGAALSVEINADGEPEVLSVDGAVVNGATPGTVQLQWAQFAAGATDTTVFEHSFLMAWQVN